MFLDFGRYKKLPFVIEYFSSIHAERYEPSSFIRLWSRCASILQKTQNPSSVCYWLSVCAWIGRSASKKVRGIHTWRMTSLWQKYQIDVYAKSLSPSQ